MTTTTMSNDTDVHGRTRNVSARLGAFKAIQPIQLPVQTALTKKMDILRLTSVGRAEGKPTDGMCIRLESGVGKTTAAHMLRQSAAKRAGKTEADGPVLIVTLDVEDIIPLWSSILRDMGDPYYDAGNIKTLKKRAINFLRRRGVELIIIDEFNHCVDRGQARLLMNTVKEILNAGIAPVVVMGTDDEVEKLPKMPAFERRMLHAPAIGPLTWEDADHALSWRGFLQGLDQHIANTLVLPSKSGLGSAKLAEALCHSCGGVVGYAHWVVQDALTEVLLRGGDAIEVTDLAISVSRMFVKFEFFDRVNEVEALA